MKFDKKIDRYFFYGRKKISTMSHGFSVSRIKGRFIGPKVILNSLPKSGTHLAETLFFNLPLIRHYGGRTIMINNHDDSLKSGIKKIQRLKKGQFAPAHIQYNDETNNFFVREDIKVVQIIRDPRDIVISHFLYVRDIDK